MSPSPVADELPRPYGPWFAGALVAASMVGAGILVTPFFTVAACGSLWGSMFLWLFGGAYALCGAAMLASVATARPKSGGEYHYVAEAFGPAAGYLYGWATLLLGFAGPIAAVALAASEFLMQAAAPGLPAADLSNCRWCAALAAVLILALGAWHCLGPKASAGLQLATTAAKLSILVGLVAAMAILAAMNEPNLFGRLNADFDAANARAGQLAGIVRLNFENVPFGSAFDGLLETLAPLLGSLAYVVFTYTGWNAAAYVAGEVRDPGRNLPRAILIACAGVTLFYLVAAFGLAAWFSADALARSSPDRLAAFASNAFRSAFGIGWLWACNGAVGAGMLATVSAFIVTGARVMHAMARSGHFPAFAGAWHAGRGAPVAALLALSAGSAAIALLGTVKDLLEYVGGGLAATGVVLGSAALQLRRSRDYRPAFVPWCDPLPTWAFTVLSALIALAFAIADGRKAAFGLLAILVALPLFAATRPRSEVPP